MTSDLPPTPNRRTLLSALWTFALFNYLYADVIGLMDATLLKQYLTGRVGDLNMTPGFLLAAAVLMELPIAMTLLTRLLPYRACRWANVGAGAFKTVVVAMTLFMGPPTYYYAFFSAIEIACTTAIAVLAWRWLEDTARTDVTVTSRAPVPEGRLRREVPAAVR